MVTASSKPSIVKCPIAYVALEVLTCVERSAAVVGVTVTLAVPAVARLLLGVATLCSLPVMTGEARAAKPPLSPGSSTRISRPSPSLTWRRCLEAGSVVVMLAPEWSVRYGLCVVVPSWAGGVTEVTRSRGSYVYAVDCGVSPGAKGLVAVSRRPEMSYERLFVEKGTVPFSEDWLINLPVASNTLFCTTLLVLLDVDIEGCGLLSS